MSDNKFGGKPLTNNDYDDYDDFDNYNDDNFDNFKYDDYDDYNPADDDEMPLTSDHRSEAKPMQYDEKPLDRSNYSDKNRPPSRRETIQRVAEEQQNGSPRKPGVTPPDTRLSPNPYAARKLNTAENEMSAGGGRRPRPANRSGKNDASRNRRPPGNNSSKKSKFAAFYIALLVVAVGLCITVLLVVLQNMEGAWGDVFERRQNVNANPEPTVNPIERAELRSQTALITNIDPFGETRTLTLLDISTRRTHEFNVSDDVRISDRLNRPLTFAELRVGNMVDIGYDARNSEILTLHESRQSWERRSRTNVRINIEEFEISVGNEAWSFNSQTLVLYQGAPFSISQIQPIDSVTLIGQGDTVWLVQLDSAHGFLQINNADMIANGSIMIGTNFIFALDDISTDIELPEGTHRVMVEGDNIETFIENIVIQQGQTTRLNLGDAQLRAAILNIVVTPADAEIFVNGELHDNTGPAQVEFGENIVRVERYGFLPQEQQLNIELPINIITFDLVEIVHDNTLVIFTVPTNAEIFIDNVFIGFSTLTHTVSAGTYSIVARLHGYESATIEVTVAGNETEDIMRTILLMPTSNDPFSNLPPQEVDPIPNETQSPFPTLPPTQSPVTTLPPVNIDENPPGDLPDTDDDNPFWWLTPPTNP